MATCVTQTTAGAALCGQSAITIPEEGCSLFPIKRGIVARRPAKGTHHRGVRGGRRP